jgi:uncharacterized membrane protein
MLLKVHSDAGDTVRRVLPRRGRNPDAEALPIPPPDAVPLPAPRSGFLVMLDEEALLSAAVKADAVLFVDACPGTLLVAGAPIGAGWPRAGGSFESGTHDSLARRVAKAARTGFERTAAHDVQYGFRQLSDVVAKALSPGINDPTTAVHALGHLTALLCEVAGRRLGSLVLRDDEARVRVVLRRPALADLLETALTAPLHYGAGDLDVMAQLLFLLRDLAWCAPEDQRPMIAERLSRVRAKVAEQRFDTGELDRLAALTRQVDHALTGHWTPSWA